MAMLVCGLNPSLPAADRGVGYAGPGNRFWPAVARAGLAPAPGRPPVTGDAWRLLTEGGVGMTDLVRRATRAASEVPAGEFREGRARVEGLVRRWRPDTLCVVGLTGWRAAVDRRAAAGWQAERFAGAAVYLMPSTSGLNARVALAELADHLARARAGLPG